MNQSPEIRRLAERLLARQRASGNGPAAAAESTMTLLSSRISPLVGVGGCRMLIARAVRRATERHPMLAEVTAVRAGDPYLEGLDVLSHEHAEAEIEAACTDIVTELLGLLARFLGEDMALRLLQQTQRTQQAQRSEGTKGTTDA